MNLHTAAILFSVHLIILGVGLAHLAVSIAAGRNWRQP